MHGNIGLSQQANRTPAHAFGASGASPASADKVVGKTVRPENDPRTKSYIEG